jgi:hypothetical protein
MRLNRSANCARFIEKPVGEVTPKNYGTGFTEANEGIHKKGKVNRKKKYAGESKTATPREADTLSRGKSIAPPSQGSRDLKRDG